MTSKRLLKPMTQATLNKMSPEAALQRLRDGNERFQKIIKSNIPTNRKLKDFVKAGAKGQFPFAHVLSCIDSRIPTETIFDQEYW